MAASYFAEFGLLWYLEELRREEFWKFKELLNQEPAKLGLKPIPWAEIKRASKEDLANMLAERYSRKQAWEVTLSIFLQINRQDLWTKAKEEMESKPNPYKNRMKERFRLVWIQESNLPVPESFYKDSVGVEYSTLTRAAAEAPGPATVAMNGPEGCGKTTILRKVMLEWAEGTLWRDRYTYVFFLSVDELNRVVETSLAELLSKDWPESAESLEDALAHPEKILFIMDGFEELKFDLNVKTDACSDWRRRWPTPVLLSSLLQKSMLPGCSLVLGFGTRSMQSNRFLLKHPVLVGLQPFSEHHRKLYFFHFFDDTDEAMRAFSFVSNIPPLFVLCESPLVCWLVCTCVKWQLDRGESLCIDPETGTSLYVSFAATAFKAGRSDSLLQNRARMKSLCSLAAEGMWTQAFFFVQEDIGRNGISESDLLMWAGMRLLRRRGDGFTFNNRSLQEFCAALYYYLRQPREQQNTAIGTVAQMVAASMGHVHTHLSQVGGFLLGISTHRILNLLETSFGFVLSKAMKPEIIQSLKSLGQHEPDKGEVNFQRLFSALFETQDEDFVIKVMNFFEEIFINIEDTDQMVIASYCLKHCRSLKKLHLCINNVFPYDLSSPISEIQTIFFWRDLCSVFTNSRKFQVLKLDSCTLDDVSLGIICKALARPGCRIESLWCNFIYNFGKGLDFSKAILHSFHLKYLNLYGTSLSTGAVTYLCETLRYPACNVEELVLGKCDLPSEVSKDLACVLICNKLKSLSLIENALGDEGANVLCEGLKHSKCALQTLIVNFCCLTRVSCDYFSQTLPNNISLSTLDLGSNILGDEGVATLCEALKHQNCTLAELCLTSCYLTPACCKDIATALTCNESLKTLKLGNNEIKDAGVKQLCEALKHPKIQLQRLGLEMCQLTMACVEDLASALITCKSLKGLNLDWIVLDHDGVVKLCEALTHADCVLELLGLDKSVYEEESQMLLSSTEEKVSHLTIVHEPWLQEEYRMRGVVPLGSNLK
uniref:NLR family pyrin domain containing 9 n=1 Tax=Oryctolagus cuniculus TaxID=9986 RepID=G1T8H9_RABIT|nr:NACHT, LRR and PYD domains-containing protein 9 [Oryctolagus cuniculus]